MSTDLSNSPAFPTTAGQIKKAGELSVTDIETSGGLTKREFLAAMAMQWLIGNSANRGDASTLAQVAVGCADALLTELAK